MSNQDKLTETPDQPPTTDHQRLEVDVTLNSSKRQVNIDRRVVTDHNYRGTRYNRCYRNSQKFWSQANPEKEKPKLNKGKTNANALVSYTVNDVTENQSQIDTPFCPVYKTIAPRSLEHSLADQTIILEQYGLTKGSLETIAILTTDSIAIQTTESVDESINAPPTDVEKRKIYTAI
ncbi:Hypothetical predicted protein [Mytilus galloprovincialis]|uniref:Uncharacterized protein n=1 Tax=Mytilus galloprovincialis TaxID=29158 RepID=A0A8B6BES6_MYTGA|nr:Hypothetical predicted protein [Mytilus galloprovincialis]